jgi:CheY-like chemotaxis protein
MLTVVREENEGFGGRISLTEQGQVQMYRHLRALRLPDAASASMLPMSFEITKPMRAVRTQVTRVQEKLAEDIEEVLSAPRARALIAVGYEALRRQLAMKLSRVGFEVLVSTSGMHALQTLVDELLALDVLILDEHLGDMTGIELLSHIRGAGGESTLPIVALTDEDEGPSRTSLLEAGASATLPVRGVESMTHASLLSLLSRSIDRRPSSLGAQAALTSIESDLSE